ncbi:hypothetical protein [Aquihabitans sp. McL0605]|uniref:hypothetical protein n=1 Tax=Aquihabitans sp. McL0605 TaxID=3415671 RepID=UPI003CF83B04
MAEELGPCPRCGRPLAPDYRVNARHPATGQWAVMQIVICPGGIHAWSRWTDDTAGAGGWAVGGRGGNEAHRSGQAGTEAEPLVEVRDWSAIRAYRRVPPSKLRSDLTSAVKEIGLLKVHKSTGFKEIVQWAIDNLPQAAPNHPRSAEAKAMATYYWRHR